VEFGLGLFWGVELVSQSVKCVACCCYMLRNKSGVLLGTAESCTCSSTVLSVALSQQKPPLKADKVEDRP
jgi:hypothetical protein